MCKNYCMNFQIILKSLTKVLGIKLNISRFLQALCWNYSTQCIGWMAMLWNYMPFHIWSDHQQANPNKNLYYWLLSFTDQNQRTSPVSDRFHKRGYPWHWSDNLSINKTTLTGIRPKKKSDWSAPCSWSITCDIQLYKQLFCSSDNTQSRVSPSIQFYMASCARLMLSGLSFSVKSCTENNPSLAFEEYQHSINNLSVQEAPRWECFVGPDKFLFTNHVRLCNT